ncbi:hypothetical protein PGH45_18480 [Legionella pneumophila]|nr:hypothetical protein [Legionella pneumophila]
MQSPLGLLELIFLRYQEPELWHHFLTVEGFVFLMTLLAIVLYVFHRLKPNNKALGNAHFSSSFETRRAGFFKPQEQSIIIGKSTAHPFIPTALNTFWFLHHWKWKNKKHRDTQSFSLSVLCGM